MRFLITSMKGGVGKSSIALNFAAYLGCHYITNDITTRAINNVIQIPEDTKRIPLSIARLNDVVFDFGALSSVIDHKIAHAAKLCDVIVIPTRTDSRSLEATISTYQLLKDADKPIVIIINHFRDKKKHDAARDYLISIIGKVPIFAIRETTLFDRVSRDGIDWYLNLKNDKGLYMLQQTAEKHEDIYHRITAIGNRSHG